MLTNNYSELIQNIVQELPSEKQQEVYDFAVFIKNQQKSNGTESSFDDLIGSIEGPSDLSSKHDQIYD